MVIASMAKRAADRIISVRAAATTRLDALEARVNLLILDIDETLIYAAEGPLERAEDFRVGPYFVYLRPFLGEFLRFAAEHFEVATWTSSTEGYATSVLGPRSSTAYRSCDLRFSRGRRIDALACSILSCRAGSG